MRRQRGFTLVEVMVALMLIATSLTVLVSVAMSNIREATRAEALNIATNLARGKMYDLEENLLKEGFQETDEEEDGDFSNEGHPDIKWKAEILVVELPNLNNVSGEEGAEGTEGQEGGMASMMSQFGLGGGDTDAAQAAGAGMIGSQMTMIQEVLKQSIRKVVLTVEWEAWSKDWPERLTVDYYVTNPSAIAKVVGGGGVAGAGTDSSGTGTTGTAGTGTAGTGTAGSGNTGTTGKRPARTSGGGGTR